MFPIVMAGDPGVTHAPVYPSLYLSQNPPLNKQEMWARRFGYQQPSL